MQRPMTTLIKIHRKGQMTLPSRLRSAIGVADGDLVEAELLRGKIVITPKLVIDRLQFPNADEEYTPAQRHAIDRGIAQSEKDYKQGRSFGPFATHEAFIASLHQEASKLGGKKRKRAAK
jgi:AbrB family looped-hinge helix DNA binding protein